MRLARLVCCLVAVLSLGRVASAQNNRVDIVAPSAPELASYGKYAIGVRTVSVTDKNRPRHSQYEERQPHGSL